jgi:iron-sulfur cluster repair protein YtfE (RIC family)
MSAVTESLRQELLGQHQTLRAELQELRQIARAVVAGQGGAADSLLSKLGALLRALEDHMTFEEGQLAPVLHGSNAAGARYVQSLEADHLGQRQELARLAREADDPDDLVSLALDVQAFVSDILLDIEEEELQFITPALLAGASSMTEGTRH